MLTKKSIISGLLSILVVSSGGAVFAESNNSTDPVIKHEKIGDIEITETIWNAPIVYEVNEVVSKNKVASKNKLSSVIKPKGVDMNGTFYEESRTLSGKQKGYGAILVNDSTRDDTVSREVSRRTFWTGTVGAEADVKQNLAIIQGEIKVSAEVQYGRDTTDKVTYTWVIPAKSTTTIEYGSITIGTRGSIVKYFNGKVTKTTNVSLDWSTDEYATKKSSSL